MAEFSDRAAPVRPAAFSRALLQALEAVAERRKRRRRDQTPDSIGLELKRQVLERAIEADPEPEAFEAWLLELALATPGSGGMRAICQEIYQEYQLACHDPSFSEWLAAGAPSDNAFPEPRLDLRSLRFGSTES